MTSAAVDPGSDLHTHSDLTDGTAGPEAMAAAARTAGLHTWGLSDHVRTDSDWVVEYAARVRGLRQDGLTIRCGVEAKMLDEGGRLDLPAALPELDYVLVADHQFPGPQGPVHPREVARQLAVVETTTAAVVDTLVAATCAAVTGSPYPPIVAHLFSLLPKMGLTEGDVAQHHIGALADACRRASAAIEINEKWRCPSARTIAALAAAGVALVAGSDAHRTDDVGAWSYLHALELPTVAVTRT